MTTRIIFLSLFFWKENDSRRTLGLIIKVSYVPELNEAMQMNFFSSKRKIIGEKTGFC